FAGGEDGGFFVGGRSVGRAHAHAGGAGSLDRTLALLLGLLFSHPNGGLADLRDGQHFIHHQALGDDGLEFVIEDVSRVNALVGVAGDDVFSDLSRARKRHAVQDANMLAGNLNSAGAAGGGIFWGVGIAALEVVATFAPHSDNVNVLA